MCAARRGLRPGADKMSLQEINDTRVAEVTLNDTHHGLVSRASIALMPEEGQPSPSTSVSSKGGSSCNVKIAASRTLALRFVRFGLWRVGRSGSGCRAWNKQAAEALAKSFAHFGNYIVAGGTKSLFS